MAIDNFYVDLVLRKKTATSDDRGGSILTNADTAFKGVITLSGSRELEIAKKMAISSTHTLYCPVTVDIEKQDIIVWGTKHYKVVSEPQNTVGRNHHYKTMLELII